MRKYLLPKDGSFYKANLHCHTTISDGRLSPSEVKELYRANGYSVVAFTDHDALIAHPELKDEAFLPLNGYEVQITETDEAKPPRARKTAHLCLIALEEDNLLQVGYHREKYTKEVNRPLIRFDESLPDFSHAYSPETVNEFIKRGREGGFFVTFNHPTWSLLSYPDYSQYEGMHAMEIANYSCIVSGYDDYNPRVYDDLLCQGKRIFAIGADDNHDAKPVGDPLNDSCGAFTVIKAKSLDYREITSALERGDIYASQGPEIKELYYDDGKVHVLTSPARSISLSFDIRGTVSARSGSEPITEATLKVASDVKYFRVTVTDPEGKPANSRAYFIDELEG